MKRFQRMNAFILALVMIVSMIPTGIFKLNTSAAEPTQDSGVGKTFLHASYAAAVTVDGTQDAGYRFDVPVGAVRLGAAWNKDGLYLSFNSADPKVVSLKVNGTSVDLTTAKTGTCTEYKVALPENLNGENKLTVKLEGQDEVTLYLSFETNNYTRLQVYSTKKGDTLASDNRSSSGTFNDTGNIYTDKKAVGLMGGSLTSPMIVEFDLDITSMPEDKSATPNNAVTATVNCGNGISVEVIDAYCARDQVNSKGDPMVNELMKFGFYNEGGKLVLRHATSTAFAKDIEIASSVAGVYHVRVEYTYKLASGKTEIDRDAVVVAKYFVNGKCVAEAENVRVCTTASAGTGNLEQLRIRPVKDVTATIGNFSVSYDQPAGEVMKTIASLGDLNNLDSAAVTAARVAYQALTDAEKAQVANYAALEALEKYAAQVQYVHATFTTATMNLDGALNEAGYQSKVKINNSVKLTASWDGKYLYLGTEGTTTPVTDLKINGTAVTFQSKSGIDTVEYKVNPEVGDYSKEYNISFKLGETTWSGKIVFDTIARPTTRPGATVHYGAEAYPVNTNPSTNKPYGSFAGDDWKAVLDSYYSADDRFAESDFKRMDLFYPRMANLTATLDQDNVVEFDLLVDYLPDNAVVPKKNTTPYRNMMYGGVNICIADDETQNINSGNALQEALWTGLYQSGGKLYFVYFDATTENKYVSALVGDYVPGTTYTLRQEFDYLTNTVSKAAEGKENNAANDLVAAKYYVNGKLVATSADAKIFTSTGNFGATKTNNSVFQLTAMGSNNEENASDTNRVDITISKLYVSKTDSSVYESLVSVEQVEQFIAAIGSSITLESETAIKKARDAYDALSDQVKALVSNLDVLVNAEAQLKVLKNSYFHAVFSTSTVVVNGTLDEAAYKRVLPLGGNLYASAAWDATNLYLAFAGENPNVTVLNVNGYNVDLSSAKTGNGTWEIAVSLNSVGMGDYTGAYTISFIAGGKSFAGKLVLDTVDYSVVTGGSLYWGASYINNKTGVHLDSLVADKDGNTYRSSVTYNNENLASVAGANTVVEFDLTPSVMPEGYAIGAKPSRAFLTGGITVAIRDEKDERVHPLPDGKNNYGREGFVFGFGKKDGQMYLIDWYNNGTAIVAGETALGVADTYHVRLEIIYTGEKTATANYYVNGVLVLERDGARIVATETFDFDFSTAQTKFMQIYAGAKSGNQEETRVVADITNVSIGHTMPNLAQEITVGIKDVEQMIDEIGMVTLDKAGQIETVLARFESLSATAQKLVKNADILKAAVSQLKVLENSFLHAAFAATSVVVDGKTDEEFFRRNLTLGNVKFGAAWDVEYLYLYFAGETAPEITALNINNVAVNTTGTAGETAREIKVKLSDLGITNLAQNYPIALQIGTRSWSGKLILDNVDFEAHPYGTLYFGAASTADKLSINLNTLAPDVNGANTDKSLALYNSSKLTAIAGESTILEFGFDPIYLPNDCTNVTATSRNFLYGGVSFTVRDDRDVVETGYGTKAFSFGFGKKNGELKLYYWYHDTASNVSKLAYVDMPIAEQYYIRIEYVYGTGEQVTARYFVNGVLVAEVENSLAYRKDGFGTAGLSNIQLYADDKEATETGRVEVGISNLSVGHTSNNLVNELATKVPEVEALIDAIGPVNKDSKAKVEEALAAFEALSILAQTQVSNAKVLETAIARLQMLENSYLHAQFTYDELSLDGRIYEAAYQMNIHMTETIKVGGAWTKDNLYLAFQGETAPKVSDLVINGKKVSITSSNSKTGAMAREIRLSLSSLGIVGYDKTYEISFRIGDVYWSGTLVQDSNDYTAQMVGSLYYGASTSTDKKTVMMNSLTPDANGANTTRSLSSVSSNKLGSVAGKITIMDLDLQINNMPANSTVTATPGRDFVNNGVSFTYRDNLSPAVGDNYAEEAMNFGFGKQNGKLKLYYWYNNEAGKATLATVDVPEAPSYHLRIEFTNGNGKVTGAKFFINGILLAEAESVRITRAGGFGTKADNMMQMFVKAASATEAGRVDVRISNISFSRPQVLIIDDASAAAYADERIMEIGTVTLESAEQINIARDYYNSLTTAQKKMVTKLSVLEAAEKALRALKDQVNAQYTSYIFADYTSKAVDYDGALKEAVWRTPQTIFGIGKFGATWDFNYLYLGFSGSKVSTLTNLKVNGKAVTDLGKVNGNEREVKILLSGVGIKSIDFAASYDISFTLDGKTWTGKVVFDTGTFKTIKPSSAFWGGVKNGYKAELNTQDSTQDGFRNGVIWDTTNLNSLNGSTTIIEMDIKVNAMPNNHREPKVGRQFAHGGIGLAIRDDDTTMGENGYGTEGFMVGLVREKGQMMLIYWDDSIDQFVYDPVEDYGTGTYHLRIEYFYYTNDEVSAKYYVNGMLIAEVMDAKEIAENGAFGTNGSNRMQIFAYGTEDGHVDAVISGLSVTRSSEKEVPGPLDALTKAEIFGNLDLNHVQHDLNLPTEFVTVNGEHFDLVWTTSDDSVVTSAGKVTRPLEATTSATLTLIVDGETLWTVTVKVDPMSLVEQESPEYVDAAFSAAPIVIDGINDEEGWRMSGRILDKNQQLFAEYGFQWTQTHLYIAVEYMDKVDTLSFKLNGRYYTVQDGKLYRGGQNVGGSTLIATKGKIMEIRIPLNVLGLSSKINYYGVQIPMSIKAGPNVGNGKVLTLANFDWFTTSNRTRYIAGYATKSTDSYHGVQTLVNGFRLYDLYGGTNAAQIRSYVSFMSTDEYIENFADRIFDTRLEFDFQADALPILPTDGSAYTTSGGAYGLSGFTCAAGEITGSDGGSLSFNYGIMNTRHGLIFVLNVGGTVQTHVLNKELGDKFSVAVEWTKDDTLNLFIDGVYIKTFNGVIGYWSTGAANASLVVNMRPLFSPNSTADNYDVTITNIAFGKVHKETGLFSQITFDTIRNKNKLENAITTDLKLPTTITDGMLDNVYNITWTSSNPSVISTTGKVTRPATGVAPVTLTATLPTGETKSFDLWVYGKKAENDSVLHVVSDVNPETGVGVSYTDRLFTLDTTNNSIIKILDGKQTINYVVLTDGDDKGDLTPESLTLWISDDNQVYTRIKDYKLMQKDNKWYLYDFEASGLYVKVHYTKPEEESDGFLTFTGAYGEMIDAGYHNTVFGSNNATFTESTYILTNNTGKDRLDYAWTISKADLGINGTDASIRIFADGKLLYHYVSGANVVVRVNDMPKGASVTLTVLSSSDAGIMDIANKEGVHEIIYGVQNTTFENTRWYYLTLPAGTRFPDGSVLETETIFAMGTGKFQTSTDGGKTWTPGKTINNAPEGKAPIESMREGGWMFDSKTGRLMFEAYIRGAAQNGSTDPNEGGFNKNNLYDSHMHTIVIISDDGGKTWYLQSTLPCRSCMDEYADSKEPTYALSYSDGTELSTNDGKGPNVDFVFPLGYQYDNIGTFACRIAYTTDGGDTWQYSQTPITYPSLYGSEGGCSEAWIIEREDGVLTLHVRAQDMSSVGFKVSYSYDHGKTWTNENIFTNYYAVNGQAFIRKMEIAGETTVIAAWGGNTSLGSATYHRNPFVFASASNDGETFRNIQNIYFRSFEEKYNRIYITDTTNVSLVSHSGDDLIFTYRRNRIGDWVITNVEDFDLWFTRTKGAYDDFEKGTLKSEGWNDVEGYVTLSDEVAQGKYSLKMDNNSMAIRSIPYLQDGTLSIDIYVTAGSDFTVELQSGHTRYYDQISVPIAFRVEGGKVYFNSSTTASADGFKEGWNTLTFDLGLSKDEATMSINGGAAIEIPLKRDFDDYVNFINIATKDDSCIYLDEFLVISETEVGLSSTDADQAAADKVIALIKAIKNAGDTAAIKAAREAFDALTQVQQDLVDTRYLVDGSKNTVNGMVNYYDQLRIYEDGELVVMDLIDDIGTVDKNSGDKIKDAEAAYKKLSSAQKAKVANYATLKLARQRYDRIISHKAISDANAAEAVNEMIDAILLTNPMRYEKQIKAARTAYNNLTADQMELVTSQKLAAAEVALKNQKEAYTRRSLASLQKLIDSLDNVTLNDLALVEGIRIKFNSLTSEQRQSLDDKKLVAAEQSLGTQKIGIDKRTLAQFRLEGVIRLIDSIGQVTVEKKGLIDAIRNSYDKLTTEQQELVVNYIDLTKAEALVETQMQLADQIPNTGDNAPVIAESTPVAMPVMLLSLMAMAVLAFFYFRKRNYR